MTGQVLYFGGIERSPSLPEGNAWRHLLDAHATISISDQVSVLFHGDAGVEPNDLGTSGWLAAAAYVRLQLASKLAGSVRGDYFREWRASSGGTEAAPIFWPADWVSSVTATLDHRPAAGLSVRLELRHDRANSPVFFGGDVTGDGSATPYEPNRRAQETVTLGATAWF